MPQRIKHPSRFLRGRRVVKVNQGMTADLLAQDREILAKSFPIYVSTGNLVHILICSARRAAPLYSGSGFPCYRKIDNFIWQIGLA